MDSTLTIDALPEYVRKELLALLREYRSRSLWFLAPDYIPATQKQWLDVLALIERYGDMKAYIRVRELRKWL